MRKATFEKLIAVSITLIVIVIIVSAVTAAFYVMTGPSYPEVHDLETRNVPTGVVIGESTRPGCEVYYSGVYESQALVSYVSKGLFGQSVRHVLYGRGSRIQGIQGQWDIWIIKARGLVLVEGRQLDAEEKSKQ